MHASGADPEFGKGGMHFAEKLKSKKKKKSHSNNSRPLPNVYTIKYIKILIRILIYSFIVKLHCLMNTVTALLEYLNLVCNYF